jgi:RNA polymerase subunit RPABC4/transcription elongation factor Spt4
VVEGAIRDRIAPGMPEAEMRELARSQGMNILIEDGMEKVTQGCTTLEEVLSVARIESLLHKVCPQCERVVESIYRFCPYCSHVLIQGCLGCGSYLKTDWKVCPFCSREVGDIGRAPVSHGRG